MINPEIPCKVLGLVNGLMRRRIGTAPVEPGTVLYYLWHEPTRLYYHECYVNEAYAIALSRVLVGPTSMGDVAQSWVSEPKHCQHSHKAVAFNGSSDYDLDSPKK